MDIGGISLMLGLTLGVTKVETRVTPTEVLTADVAVVDGPLKDLPPDGVVRTTITEPPVDA